MSSKHTDPIPSVEDDFNPFSGGALERVVPTTEPQKEIWLAAKMQPDASLSYNESVCLRLRGALNREALDASLADLAQQHPALRGTISPDGLNLCISTEIAASPIVNDLSAWPDGERQERLEASRRAHVLEPFDLEHGPLIRFELVRLGADDHALLISAHHIVCDGWSFGVILEDLGALYSAHSRGESTVTTEAATDNFPAYAEERAQFVTSEEYRTLEQYWLAQVAGQPPPLDLPTDHERLAPRSYRSEREDGILDSALLDAVRRYGARHGASLFVTLLSVFAALMSRLSGQRDFLIGVPAAGQNTEGRERLVGHLVHLLPLRVAVENAEPFQLLLKRVRSSVLDAFEHQAYTFGSLLRTLMVERDASRPTLISVMFNVDQPVRLAGFFAGLQAEFKSNPRAFENFDLSVNVVHENGGLRAEAQYGSELFDRSSVGRWLECYRGMLEVLGRADEPTVGELQVLTQLDRVAWDKLNATERNYRHEDGVHTLLRQQLAQSQDRIAIVAGQREVTYRELELASQQVAAALGARGIGAGSRVGISLERGPELIHGVLGTMCSGAAYVPLDPAFPRDRLEFMAADAQLALILTDASTDELWSTAAVPKLRVDQLLRPGATATEIAPGLASSAAGVATAALTAAYMIYTSGSTGKPKGVAVPHGAVVNFLESMRAAPGLARDDVLLAVTTLSFDIAVLELLLPLWVGARVVLATRDEAMDGLALTELMTRHRVTVMQATPATWRLLLEAGWSGSPALKALCGGEALPPDLARDIAQRVGSLWNMYGPTETTVWSSIHRYVDGEASLPIGKPIANTRIYVLDEARRLCPIGVRGELWIAGAGVALGYWQRPELTAERFVADPMGATPDARMYRTGDLGRLRFDGTLECLGRTDFQIKIRGHRIELGEIEAVLQTHPLVARAVCDARAMHAGEKMLCAYLIFRGDAPEDPATLREHVRNVLPEYMVPTAYIEITDVPLTPNGKVDRLALPAPDGAASRSSGSSYTPPQTPAEVRLAEIWSELLAGARVSKHDNFFDLGGHSLLAMRAIAAMQADTGRRIRPASYVLETLSQIAAQYDSKEREERPPERPAGLMSKLMATLRGRQPD